MSWLDDVVEASFRGLRPRERSALQARGVSEDQIELYRIGYLDRKLPPLAGAADFLKWSRGGSKLNDVFVLPLTNSLGTIKGLQFRHVDQAQKGYMDYIADQTEPVLFGLAQAMAAAWESESVFLVEGAFDLFPIQRGFPEAVATITARVTEPFARFLRRFIRRVWVGYDSDETGRKACSAFKRKHGSDFEVVSVSYPIVDMPNGKKTKDPSDLWSTWGETQFSTYTRALRSSGC
jgi:DNA primase